MITLEKSYAWCARVARTKAENFYPSFVLLTRDRHRSMCAIYAFMRYCDDLADDESIRDRRGAIAKWRADLDAALKGNPSDRPLWPAFLDTVERFGIPHKYFFEMIDGVTSDLEAAACRDFRRAVSLLLSRRERGGVDDRAHLRIRSGAARAGAGTGREMRDRRFSSPTFCATCARTRKSIACICPRRI
jgi:hypothetical protein